MDCLASFYLSHFIDMGGDFLGQVYHNHAQTLSREKISNTNSTNTDTNTNVVVACRSCPQDGMPIRSIRV